MVQATTSTVESFGESYHRLYLPSDVRSDSSYPFCDDQDVHIRIVGPALLILPQSKSALARSMAEVVSREVL
jgi:hypothetical protein